MAFPATTVAIERKGTLVYPNLKESFCEHADEFPFVVEKDVNNI